MIAGVDACRLLLAGFVAAASAFAVVVGLVAVASG